MNPVLCTTTDFVDDLYTAGRQFTKENIDALMAYCAALGSTRHEWIMDTVWALYDEDPPGGFDLLAAACEAAQRHGMRFDVVFKPFEGSLGGGVLPRSFPKPEGVPLLEERWGMCHVVRPFVAQHPEMRLARAPDDAVDPGGAITAIRLIKHGAKAIGLASEAFSLWTGRSDGDAPFEQYSGPLTFTETAEYRPLLPYEETSCRVLTFAGLTLPPTADCFLIRCHAREPMGEFVNEVENLVEIVNANGRVVPSELAPFSTDPQELWRRSTRMARLGLSRYLAHPELQRLLNDKQRFLQHCEAMNRLRTRAGQLPSDRIRVEPGSELVVMRGKAQQVGGALNPVYREVRQDWLAHVRYCIDRGVDGVNIRTASHYRPRDPWAFGFNEPTLAAMQHPGNVAEAEQVNGDAYTRFLRDAADLLHASGKELGVHVDATVFFPDERHGGRPNWWPGGAPLPRNIAWQWETWVRDIADYVEFRGAFMLRPENVARVVDRIGLAAREAGKPFIYESSRSMDVVSFDGPHNHLAWEMQRVRRHPDITAYNLYETGYFTRVNEDGRFEGSPHMADLIRDRWQS